MVESPNCAQKYPVLPCRGCGKACVVRTSRTATNPGRDFYTCVGKCDMFRWCDETGKTRPHTANSPVKCNTPVTPGQQHGTSTSQNPTCICKAGPCRVETKQNGPSTGLKYFVCHLKTGEGACTHFQWCDSLIIEEYPGKISDNAKDAFNVSNEKRSNVTLPTTPISNCRASYTKELGSIPLNSPAFLEACPNKTTPISDCRSNYTKESGSIPLNSPTFVEACPTKTTPISDCRANYTKESGSIPLNSPSFLEACPTKTTSISDCRANYTKESGSIPLNSPTFLEACPTKRKRVKKWVCKIRSLTLGCYLNYENSADIATWD